MYLNTKYIFQKYLNTKHKIHLKYLYTFVNTTGNTFLCIRRLKLKMR